MGKIQIKKRKERQTDRKEEGEKGERMQIRQTRLRTKITARIRSIKSQQA